MLAKILYKDSKSQEIIANNIRGLDERYRNILTYVDFYFSEDNLAKDEYLKGLIIKANDSGYIYLH
jgi:hypothetical protein